MDEICDICLEEVALEGLDGITLNAFWMRLENREPKFSLKLDLFAKNAIWEKLSTSADVEFYKLPEPRDLPILPTEIRKQDPVTGIIVVKTQKKKNIYPAHIISSEKYGIYGSCSTFTTRKNITHKIRDEQNTQTVTFEEVVERYGDTLVMVASPKVRMRALLGAETCPSKDFQDAAYMMLEWIGRSRHYGVFQSDTLKELKIEHKTAYYHRNWFSQSGYVTSQQVLKQENTQSFVRVNLVFLKRKTIQQPHSRYDLMSEDISKYLEKTPHRMAAMESVKLHIQQKHDHVDNEMFRRNIALMKSLGHLEKYMLPHKLVTGYSKLQVQKPHHELKVGCLRLVKIYRIESEEEEPEQVENDVRDSMLYKGRGGIDQVHDFISRSYLEDGKALTQSQIVQSLKLSKLYVRSLLRRLESQKAITSTLIDNGRQKTFVFLPINHPRDTSQKALSNVKSGSPGTPSASQSEETIANEAEEENTPVAKVAINFSQVRMEKRKDIMIKMIEARKAIVGTGPILKNIRESEDKEGLKAKVDVKTLRRLLKKMSLTNEINEFCVDIGAEHGHTCKITIFAAKELTVDDPAVLHVISQQKFIRTGRNVKVSRALKKMKLVEKARKSAGTVKKESSADKIENTDDTLVEDSFDVGTIEEDDEEDAKPMSISFEGGRSRMLPKMHKLRLAHEFFWYIVYGDPAQQHRDLHRKRKKDFSMTVTNSKIPRKRTKEEEEDKEEEEETADGWISDCEETEGEIDKNQDENQESRVNEEQDENEEDNNGNDPAGQTSFGQEKISKHSGEKKAPIIYKDVEDWRRFVAPLPRSKDRVEGWFILGDVIQRMPLSIFIQLISKEFMFANLMEYLGDPIKMHYPVNKLPKKIKQKIQVNRDYIHKIETCLVGLMRFGLSWLGPHGTKMKEERSYFLCKKAKLLDTTSSDIHYMHISDKPYPEIWYKFNSFKEVIKYWNDFMLYSLNTPLGVCKRPEGGFHKKAEETLKQLVQKWDTTLTKPDQEGCIKGDGKGACGMDSSNFTHLKRNWVHAKIVPNYRSQISKGKIQKDEPLLKAVEGKKVKRLKGLGAFSSKSDGSRTRVFIGAGKTLQVPIVKKQVSSEEHKKSSRGGKGLKRKQDKENKPTKKLKILQEEPKKKNADDDEQDKLARMRSKRQRCMWTPKEDNFILMCCITSAILDKKVKRLFVPWKEIRNILHERIEASRDKLTTSISKRATYIFNYPQTKVNYSICLTEIYEDQELINDFMSRQEDYSKPEVCAKEYRQLLDVIIEKYKKKTSEDESAITSLSFRDLMDKYDIVLANVVKDPRRYKIVNKKDVKTEKDVQRAVIQSLILGALHTQRCPDYKPSTMFNVFRQYNSSLLQDSFTYLRDVSVISRKRNAYGLSVGQLNRVLPHVPMSYQLSSVYSKFFFSKISQDIVSDMSQFWTSIEKSENGTVEIPLDPTGGCCAGALLFTALDLGTMEITLPDQLIIVDLETTNEEGIPSSEREVRTLDQEESDNEDDEDKGQDEEEEEEEEMENEDAELLKLFSETQEGWPSSTRGLLQSNSKEAKGNRSHAPKLSVIQESSEELVTSESASREDASNASLALPSTSNQSEKIEKGGIGKNGKSEKYKDAASAENRTAVKLKSLSIRHNLLILRDLVKPKLSVGRLGHLPDEVVINSCNLTLKMNDKELKEHVGAWEESGEQQTLVEFLTGPNGSFVPFLKNVPLSKCLRNVDKWLPVEIVDKKTETWETFRQRYHPSKFQVRLEDLEQVYSFIEGGKFKGATIFELEEAFPSWQECIKRVNILIKEKMVLEVGVTQLRLVTIEHISDWVVKCPKANQDPSGAYCRTEDSDGATPMGASGGDHARDQQEKEEQERTEVDKSVLEKDQLSGTVTTAKVNTEEQSRSVTDGVSLEPGTPRSETEGDVSQQSGCVASSASTSRLSLFEAIETEEDKERMYFDLVGRVFYKIDGTMNKKQLQELLTRLAGFVIENPGCREEEITKATEPVLHPIDCLLILQKLTEFGCISRHKCQQKRYRGPFAKEGHCKQIVFYMPSVDCICRLPLLSKACQETH